MAAVDHKFDYFFCRNLRFGSVDEEVEAGSTDDKWPQQCSRSCKNHQKTTHFIQQVLKPHSRATRVLYHGKIHFITARDRWPGQCQLSSIKSPNLVQQPRRYPKKAHHHNQIASSQDAGKMIMVLTLIS